MTREDDALALSTYLTAGALLDLAGPASYDRGVRYFEDGHVAAFRHDSGRAVGTVLGTYPYDARLHLKNGDLTWACSCPAAEDGSFCKHLVSLALAVGEGLADVGAWDPGDARSGVITLETVRLHLSAKPREELVELLVERALEDARFEERLRLEVATDNHEGPDLAAFRRVIDDASAVHDFLPYREAYGYAQGVEEVVRAIADLLEEGHANAVIDLTEHTLSRLEYALGRMDDSDGGITPLIEELETIHLAACERAAPEPEALARRLFERELHGDWDVFYGAALRYRHVLGARGRAAYRDLAKEEWARVPELGPGERDPERYGARFRITGMMKALTRSDGDLEELIDIMARDLSQSYRFLRIAEILKEAGEDDGALEWAERGMAAFPESDHRLTRFVAREYQRLGRGDEAVALVWDDFARVPRLDQYEPLRQHAELASVWPEWRERALALLRERRDRSELVHVLLWEDDADAAWEAAVEGGCSEDLWFQLAQERGEKHPADAIPIFQRAAKREIDRKNKHGYAEAVDLMQAVEDLMGRSEGPDGPEAFTEYVAKVRAEHRRKRNLMALLDGKPW